VIISLGGLPGGGLYPYTYAYLLLTELVGVV